MGRFERFGQQGDVLLRKVAAVPEGAVKVAPVRGRFVLAEGEVTGHAHVVDAGLGEFWEKDGRRFLQMSAPGVVEHEEHGVVEVDPGIYEVGIVRTVDPYAEEMERIRRVAD